MNQAKNSNSVSRFTHELRDENGGLIFEMLPINQLISKDAKHLEFMYMGEKYYMKKCPNIKGLYNELIALELANDYGIKCTYNDIVFYNDDYYIISLDVRIDGSMYIPTEEILPTDRENDLEDIWFHLEQKYENPQLVARLMDEIVDVFLFDILIGNFDRHIENYGILIHHDDISLAPLFDNGEMLSSFAVYDGEFAMGIDIHDYSDFHEEESLLHKFLRVSDRAYAERLSNKLSIISNDNMEDVIRRVELKIKHPMNTFIKQNIIKMMEDNRQSIINTLNGYTKRR